MSSVLLGYLHCVPHHSLYYLSEPDELYSYLEEEAALGASREERVKGYKVKVQYQPLEEEEKKAKREAIAQVILQALRRLKQEK